ncbi:MAG: GntR family transcriptional regulator [Pseudoflavonifractor sp.]
MQKIVSPQPLYEQVVERLKNLICQGVYQKGDLLPSEKDLVEMMGVSRITVREALRLLGEAGVIETFKGKGSFVVIDGAQMTSNRACGEKTYPKNFLDSTNARLLLEPAIAREAALHATEAEVLGIAEHLHAGSDELQGFHRSIVMAAHNPVLLEFFDRLIVMEDAPPMMTLVPPFRQKSVAAKLQQQHEAICAAIRRKDGEFAYFYMLEHQKFLKATYEEFFNVFYA